MVIHIFENVHSLTMHNTNSHANFEKYLQRKCFILQVSLSHTNSRILSLVETYSATWQKLFKQFDFIKSSRIDQAVVRGKNCYCQLD